MLYLAVAGVTASEAMLRKLAGFFAGTSARRSVGDAESRDRIRHGQESIELTLTKSTLRRCPAFRWSSADHMEVDEQFGNPILEHESAAPAPVQRRQRLAPISAERSAFQLRKEPVAPACEAGPASQPVSVDYITRFPVGECYAISHRSYNELRASGWPWVRAGKQLGMAQQIDEAFKVRKKCRGALKCPQCLIPTRPPTENRVSDRHLAEMVSAGMVCERCRSAGQEAFLTHTRCDGQLTYVREAGSNEITITHSGAHEHPQTQARHLTTTEKDEVKAAEKARLKMTATSMANSAREMSAAKNRDSNKKRLRQARDAEGPFLDKASYLDHVNTFKDTPGVHVAMQTGEAGDLHVINILTEEQVDWFAMSEDAVISFDTTYKTVCVPRQACSDEVQLSAAIMHSKTANKWLGIYYAFHLGSDVKHFASMFTCLFRGLDVCQPGKRMLHCVVDWADAPILGWVTAFLRVNSQMSELEVLKWADLDRPEYAERANEALLLLRGCWFHFRQALNGYVSDLSEQVTKSVVARFKALKKYGEAGKFGSPEFLRMSDEAWEALLVHKPGLLRAKNYWTVQCHGIRWRMLMDVSCDSSSQDPPNHKRL